MPDYGDIDSVTDLLVATQQDMKRLETKIKAKERALENARTTQLILAGRLPMDTSPSTIHAHAAAEMMRASGRTHPDVPLDDAGVIDDDHDRARVARRAKRLENLAQRRERARKDHLRATEVVARIEQEIAGLVSEHTHFKELETECTDSLANLDSAIRRVEAVRMAMSKRPRLDEDEDDDHDDHDDDYDDHDESGVDAVQDDDDDDDNDDNNKNDDNDNDDGINGDDNGSENDLARPFHKCGY